MNVNIFLFIFFSLLHNVRAQLNQNQNTGDGGGLYPTQDPSSSPSVSNFAENNNDNNVIVTKNSINLALSPIENDLLTMNIKEGGEANYNIHELPNNDGKSFNILFRPALCMAVSRSYPLAIWSPFVIPSFSLFFASFFSFFLHLFFYIFFSFPCTYSF